MLQHPQIDPVALQIGPLAIHWYGLTYLAAFGLFFFLGTRRLRHELVHRHAPRPARLRRERPRLEHAHRPEPFIEAGGRAVGFRK